MSEGRQLKDNKFIFIDLISSYNDQKPICRFRFDYYYYPQRNRDTRRKLNRVKVQISKNHSSSKSHKVS